MTSLARILKDYQESGALHSLVSVQSAIADGVFATKSGDLMMLLSLRGRDHECLDAAEIDHITRRFESHSRVFDDRFRIYQYLLKRQDPALPSSRHANPVVDQAMADRHTYLTTKIGRLYSLETYMAVVYEGWRPPHDWNIRLGSWITQAKNSGRGTLSTEKTFQQLESGLDAAREFLTNKVRSFAVQLGDFMTVEVLDSQRGFSFLYRLLNYAPYKTEHAQLKYNSFVDFQLCSSSVECHRNFLRLDDSYVQVLTLKEPPARTFAHMLRDLIQIPSNFLIATEWKAESVSKIRHLIKSKQRHFHNSKASLMNYVGTSKSGATPDMLIDDSAVAQVTDLGHCLEEIEVHGRWFGEFSLSVVLYDQDEPTLRRSVAHCFKIFGSNDAQLTEERPNRLNAWLAGLPGNSAYNLRKLWLLSTNYADLSFLFTVGTGNVRNEHLGTEYLAVLEGSAGVPYFLNLHYKDVAHTLVLGATGSGKSFDINFLLTCLQKYEPFTYVFDLGGSYETLTRLFGGSYLRISVAERPFTINPFCLPPTPENLLFLFAFVRVLVQSNGYPLTAEDEKDLYEQIENLYSVAPSQRRLSTLSNILHRNLRSQLQKWVEGGPYGSLFDNVQDNLTLSRFQTFDFEGMDKAADQLEPLIFYILHRANAIIFDASQATTFKAFVMDEAWRFFRHPLIKSYITEALKTWRKKNAAMILATQSASDLLDSDMLPTVIESCPTKLFLANPDIDRDAYRRAFNLNETETDLIARLVPKQQILVKQPDASKIVQLNVGPKEYWLYTNNPQDNQRRRDAFERHGFVKGLESLTRGNA